jgi:hypothetical protein
MQWNLADVAFNAADDGGSATGHATFDTVSNQVADFDFVATPGKLITTGYEYEPATATLLQSNAPGNAFLQVTSNSGNRDLFLQFGAPLTAAGGTVPLLHSPGSFEEEFFDPQLPPRIREVAQGEIVAQIPEPGELSYIWVGALIASIAAFRRKKRP